MNLLPVPPIINSICFVVSGETALQSTKTVGLPVSLTAEETCLAISNALEGTKIDRTISAFATRMFKSLTSLIFPRFDN